jgi:hypothetical protein
MHKVTLTFIDTTGIQPYIFASNRLRENIGASFLIEEFSNTWVKEALHTLGGTIPSPSLEEPRTIESGAKVEIIYSAGGNSAILFQEPDDAIVFTKTVSRRLLKEAPGLNIVVAHTPPFDFESKNLKAELDNLIKTDIEAKKNERRPSVPQLGLSVTASCASTRLAAIGMSDPHLEERSYRISREVQCKIKASSRANEHLQQFFKGIAGLDAFEFPLQLDHLGRSPNESSYVAVIHADGNAMGERFRACGKSKNNREYIQDLRQLSWSVQAASKKALRAVVEKIVGAIEENTLFFSNSESIALKEKKGSDKVFLPFRPIVFGGDDTTFVCEGRLGIALATIYLETFEQEMGSDGQNFTASAGVSIAKVHYPFARSYEMSTSLCQSAKRLNQNQDKPGSAIDWHISTTGLMGSLEEIREREYTVDQGRLYLRPVWITAQKHPWRNRQKFQQVVENFREEWSHNKVMALREELRRGDSAVENFLKIYQLDKLPTLSDTDVNLAQSGWGDDDGKRICGYFDAIESLDFFKSI